MSSRAVRKTTGRTNDDDLAQVLKKVGLDRNDDDDENENPTDSNRRQNVFQCFLDDDENDENPMNEEKSVDETERISTNSNSKSKKKRKTKKKTNVEPTNDDDLFVTTTETSTDVSTASKPVKDSIAELLVVDNRFLNPTNEMKKKFGSAIVEQIERENNPNAQLIQTNMSGARRRALLLAQQQQRPTTRLAKQNAFIVPKIGWPKYFKLGLLIDQKKKKLSVKRFFLS